MSRACQFIFHEGDVATGFGEGDAVTVPHGMMMDDAMDAYSNPYHTWDDCIFTYMKTIKVNQM